MHAGSCMQTHHRPGTILLFAPGAGRYITYRIWCMHQHPSTYLVLWKCRVRSIHMHTPSLSPFPYSGAGQVACYILISTPPYYSYSIRTSRHITLPFHSKPPAYPSPFPIRSNPTHAHPCFLQGGACMQMQGGHKALRK